MGWRARSGARVRSYGTILPLMRIAFDTGGTFTDCIYLRNGHLEILKVSSTPQKPADAIAHALDAIRQSGVDFRDLEFICGTTVGTNALLQRKGGRVALVTTAGFEDILEIGRQARPQLYNLLFEKPEPLVPRARRLGLRERLDHTGRVLLAPSSAEIKRIIREAAESAADSIAVCLLFSFVNPAHERRLARALSSTGLPVSLSHVVLPEYREFERTSTTVVNAYLVPVMSGYLSAIEQIARARSPSGASGSRRVGQTSGPPKVRIMQSSGGVLSAQAAAREPVRTILSGPAGGILGAQFVAAASKFHRIITFDMGGTSTDVALLDAAGGEEFVTTSESVVSGMPVAVPMLDIHTVGAGGGSIARFDRAGALRVGPESAGADPGPICYGSGERPTVTDANLVLGRIPESGLLGGTFKLDLARALAYMNRRRGPMWSTERFAQGVIDVANAVMERAIRVISVERGHDPRDFTLVAFGGAGGLHACELAAALDIPRVLVPCFPGALSALGILRADVTKELSRTVRLVVRGARDAAPELLGAFAALERGGRAQMAAEGFNRSGVEIHRSLDIRYAGQSYELNVPFERDFLEAFHRAHDRRNGYLDRARRCEIVNIRARFTGRTPKFALPKLRQGGASAAAARVSQSRVEFHGRRLLTPIYNRARLLAGNRLRGPAIVTEYSATTLIPPEWSGRVDRAGNLILEPRP